MRNFAFLHMWISQKIAILLNFTQPGFSQFWPVFSVFVQNGKFRIYPANGPFEIYFSKLKKMNRKIQKFQFWKSGFFAFLSLCELCKLSKNAKNRVFGVFEKRKIELDSNRGLSFLIFGSFEILRTLTFGLILGVPDPWRTPGGPRISGWAHLISCAHVCAHVARHPGAPRGSGATRTCLVLWLFDRWGFLGYIPRIWRLN